MQIIYIPVAPVLHERNSYIPLQNLCRQTWRNTHTCTPPSTYIQRLRRIFSMLDICAAFTPLQLSATKNTRHFYSAKTLPCSIFVTAAVPHTTQRLFSLTTSKITFPGKNLLLPAPTHISAPLSYRQNHRTRQKAPFQTFQQ